MTQTQFGQFIAKANFRAMFSEMGWNVRVDEYDATFAVADKNISVKACAEKNGFVVYAHECDKTPSQSDYKSIDRLLKKRSNDYILIFVIKEMAEPSNNEPHHLWLVPVKTTEKRNLVAIEYANISQTAFLYSKIDELSFALDETVTIFDVVQRVQKAFETNSEKVTKNFYAGFRQQHKAFQSFVSGIENAADSAWYASVMLNRLMFCYFIQKKGFLDFDTDYLRHKLEWTKALQGENKFFGTFYKKFLCVLFQEGLNKSRRSESFEKTYGHIPYLNGGLFDLHEIEAKYSGIDIADEAFEKLFDFFDLYRWHLDTRIEASGRDINPDVLGYIFEQYINDRAQMGAYYTKEDITEYIGKSCILPFILEKVKSKLPEAFAPDAEIWQMLEKSGSRYIYAAAKHGSEAAFDEKGNWTLPEEIACGIENVSLRGKWNTPAPAQFALATEIWREAVERLSRYRETKTKIESGGIKSINDFITYNLDIRSFAEDIIECTQNPDLVSHFYQALREISVLDPTCGSGAFLFAALNILEPLYEACIERLKEFASKDKNLFRDEIAELAENCQSNVQYFVYKSIILRNLYGVDIMREATEIAKLRLFLKLVAVVDVSARKENLGLDPLPDIDFNIKCGNTLVGYASEKELLESFEGENADMFEAAEWQEKVAAKIKTVSHLYTAFRQMQIGGVADRQEQKCAEKKRQLQKELVALNDMLDKRLFGNRDGISFENWKAKARPFHWLSEYYGVLGNRAGGTGNSGFDVIIGNPPYVSYNSQFISENYELEAGAFSCSDIYGYVINRVISLLQRSGWHGFIVMHNLAFSKNFKDVREILKNNSGAAWFSFYGRIPSGLFSGDVRVRNTIYIMQRGVAKKTIYTTRLHRWFSECRGNLFQLITYGEAEHINGLIPMSEDNDVLKMLCNKNGSSIGIITNAQFKHKIHYKKTAYNWLAVSDRPAPCFDKNGEAIESSETGIINLKSNELCNIILLLLSGKIIFARWLVFGDDFHLTKDDLVSFVFPFDKISKSDSKRLLEIAEKFKQALPSTIQYKLNAGKNIGTYNTAKLWHLTDESDFIFLKYLCDDAKKMQQQLDNLIAKCAITGKADAVAEEES